MRIKSKVDFSGVPKGTIGFAEKDGDLWLITWDNITSVRGLPFEKRALYDWFNEWEFKQYLEVLE
jgi:hypothetical protein